MTNDAETTDDSQAEGDARARVRQRSTPYDRFLPDPDFPARHFEAIRAEAASRGGGALDDPGAFTMLEAVGEALDEVRLPDEGPDTLAQHALVLWHALHFEAEGRVVVTLGADTVRELAATEPWGADWPMDVDPFARSCYLQLPRHLVWARVGEGPPASIDGFFRTVVDVDRMHLLPVVDLLEGRAGFTVLPLPGLPLPDAPTWATAPMRQDGEDFASDIPGAELEGLLEVRTAGEVLKLVARATAWIARTGG